MGFLMTFQTYIVHADHTPTALFSLTFSELSSSFQLVSLLPVCVCVGGGVRTCMHACICKCICKTYGCNCVHVFVHLDSAFCAFVCVHPIKFY